MKFFDLQIPFFFSIWRRVLLVAFCWGWACVEFWFGATAWGGLFVLIGGIAAWQFFFKPWPDEPES